MTQATAALKRSPAWQRILVYALGTLTLAPMLFMLPEIVTVDADKLSTSNADVLGNGVFIIFVMMLCITPLQTITGRTWFLPLRWWFGVMFFATAVLDLTIASIVTGGDFHGGFFGRIAGHIFLLLGTLSTLLGLPLVLTASHRAQRSLGKYWKGLQRITYVIWALILLHLLILFNIHGAPFHRAVEVSLPLLILRIPVVRKWIVQRSWRAWSPDTLQLAVVLLPLLLVFGWGFYNLVHEEISVGWAAFVLNPPEDA